MITQYNCEYKWEELAHDLAVDFLGWCWSSNHQIYMDDLGCRKVNKSDWKPYEDLNQTKLLTEEIGPVVQFSKMPKGCSPTFECWIGFEKDCIRHDDLAKAIMIAVTKWSDLNLSDYEKEKEKL